MKKPQRINYHIETHYDEFNLVHHWNWFIYSNVAEVRNRKPITKNKNQAYDSLARHVMSLFRQKIDRSKVKHFAYKHNGERYPEKD